MSAAWTVQFASHCCRVDRYGAMPARRAAGECLKRVDLGRALRLLGVRAASLARA